MTRTILLLIAMFVAGTARAQTECRMDPQSPDLQFSGRPGGKTLEFRSRAGGACVLTLDCTLRGSPEAIDYFVMPQRAGDPPAVWDIRSARFRFIEGGEQSCNVTATSEPRPPLAEPPPFIRRPKKN